MRPSSNPREEHALVELTSTAAASPTAAAASVIYRPHTRRVDLLSGFKSRYRRVPMTTTRARTVSASVAPAVASASSVWWE